MSTPQRTIASGDGEAKMTPAAIEFFTMDWADRRLQPGVLIATDGSTWDVRKPAWANPLTIEDDAILAGNTSTKVQLSDGTLGAVYEITNTITTDEAPPQVFQASFKLRIVPYL